MCIFRMIRKVVFWGVVAGVAGWLLMGSELGSYVRSSARAMRNGFKSSVPVDFQLRRARDLLAESGPEMQANIRLIAQQEVEIDHLKYDVAASERSLTEQQARVQKLRAILASAEPELKVCGITYTREQLKEELSHSFDRYREAEAATAAKKRLLDGREKSLVASMQALDRVRSQRMSLENQIAALDAQNHLIQVASHGSELSLDTSKLAQAEKLLTDVKKQLDVSERVLAYDAKFTQPIPLDTIDEKSLLSAVDSHFTLFVPTTRPSTPAVAQLSR